MRNKYTILLVLSFFLLPVFHNVKAQEQKGIITYEGRLNIKYKDSFLKALERKPNMPMHIKQGVVDMYMNATPIDIKLEFEGDESYCYPVKVLNDESSYNMGTSVCINDFYTNIISKKTIKLSDYLGYILCDPLDWNITNNMRKIGDYVCYEATAMERLFHRKGYVYYKKVSAWFAPEIPLNFGPKHYNGLPGLILEVGLDRFTITAKKINFNVKEVDISRPNPKTKVLTFEEVNNYIVDTEKSLKENR